MALKIDSPKCIGCGLCESLCPQVFKLGDDGKIIIIGEENPDNQDSLQEAIDSCPVQAIIKE